MLFLDLAREGIWEESVVTRAKEGNEKKEKENEKERGRWSKRRVRREVEQPMECDQMMLRRLRRRLGSDVGTVGRREKERERRRNGNGNGNGNIIGGIRWRRQRQVLRPRRSNGERKEKKLRESKALVRS